MHRLFSWNIFLIAFITSIYSIESKPSGINLNKGDIFVLNHDTGVQTYSGKITDTFQKLAAQPGVFHRVTKEMDSWFDSNASAFWLKVQITPAQSGQQWNIREKFQLNAWDYLTLYSTCTGSLPQKSGMMIPVKYRSIQKGVLLFHLPECSQPFDLYIQMISTHSISVKKTEFLIEKNDATTDWLEKHYYFQGAYLGIVVIMAIYNFFLFLSLRDKSYLYYVLFISTFGILWTSYFGISSEFFWPQASEWNVTSTFYLTSLSAILGTLFVIHYLNTAQNLPQVHKVLIMNCILYLIASILGLFHIWGFAQNLLALISMISATVFLFASIRLMMNGYRPAYYLFFAWSILIVGIVLYSLAFLGIISYNLFISYGIEIGSVVEVGLLSFGLAERINIIKREKEKIISAARENEYRLSILKARNEVMEMDLEMAQEIQESLITQIRYPNISTLYLPMEKVGGDFFDIIPLDNNRTAIFLADVSGHGVPAALITALLKSWISNETENKKLGNQNSWLDDPEKFLLYINNIFSMDVYKRFLSAIYGIYNKQSNTFTWSSAAHPPLLIFPRQTDAKSSQASFLEMKPQGPPLGVFPNKNLKNNIFKPKNIQLNPGDRILLYSDGLMEEVNYTYENKHLGLASFENNPLYTLLKNFSSLDINHSMDIIKSFLNNLHSGKQRIDDICLVLIETAHHK